MTEITPARAAHLKQLEAESIHIIRELVAEFRNPLIHLDITGSEQRDPKGLYQQAREGKIQDFTGISTPHSSFFLTTLMDYHVWNCRRG